MLGGKLNGLLLVALLRVLSDPHFVSDTAKQYFSAL